MAFVVFLAYSNSLRVPYILDDEPHLRYNPTIQLTSLTWSNLLKVGFDNVDRNRPVANISFGLNYYFHQYNVMGYHLVNIVIHIITGILFYFLIKTTLNLSPLCARYGSARWLAFAAAVIWLLHPIQTQSVTYIVQRMNSLAAMFYILAMLCYVQARIAGIQWKKWLLLSVSLAAGFLAVGSKENAATLPFFILLYEWYFFQDLSRAWLKRCSFYLAGVAFLLAGLVYLYLGDQPLSAISAGYQGRDFTIGQRLLTEFRVVVFYLSLLLFPHPSRLNLDHDFAISRSLLVPPTTLPSIIVIICFFVLAVCLAPRQRLFSFGILWFLGNLVIESSVIGLEIIFEHRNYLPSMFPVLLAVILAGRCLRMKLLQGTVLSVAVILLSVWTYERNWVWGTEVRLWSDCAEKSPQKARPHNNLGTSMFKQGRTKEAIVNYSKVLQIEPDHAIAHNNLGFVMASLRRFKVAIMHYSEAIRVKPNYERAHYNLATLLRRDPSQNNVVLGYSDVASFAAIDLAESYLVRGLTMADMGHSKEALDYFSLALQINPDHQEAHFQRGTMLATQGKIDEAIRHFLEALRIRPDDADVHFNLGNALAGKNRFEEAISHFSEALRLKPEDMDARRNLTILRRTIAAQMPNPYYDVLRIKPQYEKVHFDLEDKSANR